MIVSPSHQPVGPDGQENEGQRPDSSVGYVSQNGRPHDEINAPESTPDSPSDTSPLDAQPAAGTEMELAAKRPETPAILALTSPATSTPGAAPALSPTPSVLPQPVTRATALTPTPPAPAAVARQKASYDALRQRIAVQELRRRSLFLSSVGAGEGTTTAALYLARSLARETSSVLLVELRFTSPHLRERLKVPAANAGLEEGLRGIVPFSDCLAPDSETPLSLLTMKQPMPAEEAAHKSGELNDLLQWAEDQFEWLVLDCPPVTSPDWTLWFDLNADPVLLVVRSGVTRQHAVQKAGRRLKDRLAGAILFQP